MVLTEVERLKVMRQVDQLEGDIAELVEVIEDLALAFLIEDETEVRRLRARAAELHEHAMSV